MVFHLVPLVAFSSSSTLRISWDPSERQVFYPLGASGWSANVNLDGYVIFTDQRDDSKAYTQVFRTGVIEAVAAFQPWGNGELYLSASWIQNKLIEAFRRFTEALVNKEVEPPFFVFLAFLKARGYQLATSEGFLSGSDILTDRDSLILPEVEIEQVGFDPAAVLRPLFDMLWNAFGYENCQDYDEHGVYIKR